jgi:hypothetical protein
MLRNKINPVTKKEKIHYVQHAIKYLGCREALKMRHTEEKNSLIKTYPEGLNE